MRQVRLAALCLLSITFSARLAAQDDLVTLEESAFKEAARNVADSIVQIRTVGGLDARDGVLVGSGATSGIIIGAEGWIVSSAYNLAQRPSSILVSLPGGGTAAARLVATDHSRMIVLLKVDHDTPLPVPAFAEEEARVGQWAISLGKAYSPTQPNISTGVISAIDRMHGRVIQTDAKVSAVNYGGPLVDIRGRLLGILVPMSPQGETAVAGAEWYDSGIGFAVPIGQILARLDEMKAGHNQWPGKMGVALKPGPAYSTPPEVVSVDPNSPAAKADIAKGDLFTQVEGTPIANQRDFFYQIRPRYAGETLTLTVRRGDATLSREVTLVDQLRPYVAGFLGVLPEPVARSDDAGGMQIRFVYPNSPAARADLRSGDRITRMGESAIASNEDALTAMQAVPAGTAVELEIVRDGQSRTLTIEAAALPEAVPEDIPPPRRPAGEQIDDEAELGDVVIKLADLTRECPAHVPRTYRPDVPHGMLVWLGEGDAKPTGEWIELCERYDLILLAPAAEGGQWLNEDLEYLSRVMREVSSRYAVDAHRVVVGGERSGATAAFALAGQERETVRGVAASMGGPPRDLRLSSDPVRRLAILMAFSETGEASDELTQTAETLRDAALPVTLLTSPGELTRAETRAAIAQWIDTLDRL